MVKRLLKLPGGFEEAATRATRLMRNTPKFLNGTVPDLATLVQHYDKLVADSSSLSNWDLRSMADELERQGR